MNVLDLFSGVGGFSLGLERAGMRTVAFCEIDPFCRRVLAKHWPHVPCYDDVRTADFPAADIVVGGFPCQDVSCAGKRAGITGERSGLYRELVRALRLVRPRYGLVENVAALLGDGMGTVLGDMAESGFDTEWDCVPACAVGAPHERDRVWIVAHADSKRQQQPAISGQEIGLRVGNGAQARPVADATEQGRAWRSAQGLRRQTGHVATGGTEPGHSGGLDTAGLPDHPDTARNGRRQGRTWRPPDSFAGIRDQARRNAADPYGARLAFRAGLTRDAWEKLSPAERDRISDGGQSIWPDEPALSGMDDGIPDWMDRVKATGNTVIPQIVETIGAALMARK